MPTKSRSRSHLPKVGQEVFLKGRVTKVEDKIDIDVLPQVTIKLERYDDPITIRWLNSERDDSIRSEAPKAERLHS